MLETMTGRDDAPVPPAEGSEEPTRSTGNRGAVRFLLLWFGLPLLLILLYQVIFFRR